MKRILYLDYLRALAIFGIVLIHSFDPFVVSSVGWKPFYWYSSLFISSLFRFSVPMYVMISGALLLSKDVASISKFYKRRLYKIFLPLVTWTTIFMVVNQVKSGSITIENLTSTILFGQPFYLIYALLGLYLFTPFLKRMIDHIEKKELLLVTVLISLITSASSMVESWLLADSNILAQFSFTRFIQFLGYYLLGYWLYQEINFKKNIRPLLLWQIITAGVIFLLTALLYNVYQVSAKTQTVYQYLSPLVFLSTALVFTIFKDLNFPHSKFNLIIKDISLHSYGIYFVHMLIVWEISGPIHNLINLHIFSNMIIFLISFSTSWLTVKAVSRFKPLGKLLGFC